MKFAKLKNLYLLKCDNDGTLFVFGPRFSRPGFNDALVGLRQVIHQLANQTQALDTA